MTTSNDEKWINKKFSRRDMLKLTSIGAAGVAIGASGFGGVLKAMGYDVFEPVADSKTAINKIDFYGQHQSGIITPVQTHIYFASLNILVTSKKMDTSCCAFNEWRINGRFNNKYESANRRYWGSGGLRCF